MKLVNMKRDPVKATPEPASVCCEQPSYPWGLSITLDNETIDKLKLDPLPEAGETLILMAKVRVSSVSSNDNADGTKYRSVTLQITDCGLEDGGERKDAAGTLYSKE